MATYIEDENYEPTQLEAKLMSGLSYSKLDRLRQQIMKAVLDVQQPHAQAHRLTQIANLLEPGVLLDTYFDAEYLAASFSSKRRLLAVDTDLTPFYGLVTGAMTELRNAGVNPAITDMWMHHFLQDNGHYRAQVVASMCVVGAFSDLGHTVIV